MLLCRAPRYRSEAMNAVLTFVLCCVTSSAGQSACSSWVGCVSSYMGSNLWCFLTLRCDVVLESEGECNFAFRLWAATNGVRWESNKIEFLCDDDYILALVYVMVLKILVSLRVVLWSTWCYERLTQLYERHFGSGETEYLCVWLKHL